MTGLRNLYGTDLECALGGFSSHVCAQGARPSLTSGTPRSQGSLPSSCAAMQRAAVNMDRPARAPAYLHRRTRNESSSRPHRGSGRLLLSNTRCCCCRHRYAYDPLTGKGWSPQLLLPARRLGAVFFDDREFNPSSRRPVNTSIDESTVTDRSRPSASSGPISHLDERATRSRQEIRRDARWGANGRSRALTTAKHDIRFTHPVGYQHNYPIWIRPTKTLRLRCAHEFDWTTRSAYDEY